MLKNIVENLLTKVNQNKLKAFYDAIRRLGPDAIPTLLDILQSKDTSPEMKTAALNAMGGLRAMARTVPNLLKDGKTVEQIAKQLEMPVETIQKWIDAGAWKPEHTAQMVDSAWEVLHSGAPEDFRENSISTLYNLSDESPAAMQKLLEVVKTCPEAGLRDRALSFVTSRMTGKDAGPLAQMALDESRDLAFRMKTGLSYLEATKRQPDSPERTALRQALFGPAEAMMVDPSASPQQRGQALEVYGRLAGENGHPRLRTFLRSGEDDTVRCAALKTLSETQGLESSRAEIEAIAAEPGGSASKMLAQRLIKMIMPRR